MRLDPPEGGFYVGAPGYIEEPSSVDGPVFSPGVPRDYSLRKNQPNTMLDQPAFVITAPMPGQRLPPDQTMLNSLEYLGITGGLPTWFRPANRAASTVHAGPGWNLNGYRFLLIPAERFNQAQRNPTNPSNVGNRGSRLGSRARAPAVSPGGG